MINNFFHQRGVQKKEMHRKRQISNSNINVLLPTKNGHLSADGTKIIKSSKKLWTCNTRGNVGWSSGVHAWSVTLETAPFVSVGICRDDIHQTDCEQNNDKRMDIYCRTGHLALGEDLEFKEYLPGGIKEGDTLTFLLDLHQGKLSVALNGKWQPRPAFENIPEGFWYPYVCIERKGCGVSINYVT